MRDGRVYDGGIDDVNQRHVDSEFRGGCAVTYVWYDSGELETSSQSPNAGEIHPRSSIE